MSREEERNTTAHKIAWEYTKHYDPLLSKESWCEMAARDAIDWADQHPRKGLWDSEKVYNVLKNMNYKDCMFSIVSGPAVIEFDADMLIKKLRKAMEN